MIDVCKYFIVGLFGFLALLAILLHLPNSPLKALAYRALAGLFALFTPLYVVSPIDIIPDVFFPFGILDDLIVLVFGFLCACYAIAGSPPAEKPVAEPAKPPLPPAPRNALPPRRV